MTPHVLEVKIYYEDTDCGGVVYYANYLKYMERARTEFLESRGVNLRRLMDEGIVFVVSEVAIKYLASGRYGDLIGIETTVGDKGHAFVVFHHHIVNNGTGEALADASAKLVCVGRAGRPVRMGADMIKALTENRRDRS